MPNEKIKQREKAVSLCRAKSLLGPRLEPFIEANTELSLTLKIHPVHRDAELSHIRIPSQAIWFDGVGQTEAQNIFVFQHVLLQMHCVFTTLILGDFKRLQRVTIYFDLYALSGMLRNHKSSELHRQIKILNLVQSKNHGSFMTIRPTKFSFRCAPTVPEKVLRFRL